MAITSTQASNIALSRSVTINRNTAVLKQNAAIANKRCSALRSAKTRTPIAAKMIRIRIIKLKLISNGLKFNTCSGIDASKDIQHPVKKGWSRRMPDPQLLRHWRAPGRGYPIHTSATDFARIEQLKMMLFKNGKWDFSAMSSAP